MRTTKQKWAVVDVKRRKILNAHPMTIIDFDDVDGTSKKRCTFKTKEDAEAQLKSFGIISANALDYEKRRIDRINDPNDALYSRLTPSGRKLQLKRTRATIALMEKEIELNKNLEVKELKITYTTI